MTLLVEGLDSLWVLRKEPLGNFGCCLANGLVGRDHCEHERAQSVNRLRLAIQLIQQRRGQSAEELEDAAGHVYGLMAEVYRWIPRHSYTSLTPNQHHHGEYVKVRRLCGKP